MYQDVHTSRQQVGRPVQKIIAASFSEDVLINGNNSEALELDENQLVVLRVLEHIPEQKKPLEDVRLRITTRIKYERASDETKQLGIDIIKELKAQVSREDIASRRDVEWNQVTGIKRDDTSVNRAILRTAFRLGRPVSDKPVYGGSSLGSGDYAVIIINKVKDADISTLKEEELKPIENQLQRMESNIAWIQFVKDLRERAKIQVNSNRL